jgi:oxygen-independent coproporphyrinogen-3 oxidase
MMADSESRQAIRRAAPLRRQGEPEESSLEPGCADREHRVGGAPGGGTAEAGGVAGDVRPLGVYIHIPYCATRCHYCDFNTYRFAAGEARRFLDALALEIDLAAAADSVRGRPICSVFFGGGTPSILAAAQLVDILDRCRTAFVIEGGSEISLEANPGTVDLQKLLAIRDAGVNRLSLGVQAVQERLLRRIGRSHTADDAERAFWMAREAGFRSINLDLMFGLPDQTVADWSASLAWALRLNPEHLSTYGLTLEAGTRLYHEHQAGLLTLPDEETVAAMYALATDLLRGAGFEHYEISNFARPGFRCRHNLVYWELGEYVGLGPGAHSFLDGRRYHNTLLPAAYIRSIRERGTAVAGGEQLSLEMARRERLLLGLRLRDGLDLQAVRETLEVENPEACARVAGLLDEGWLRVREGRLQITDRALLVADELIVRLL